MSAKAEANLDYQTFLWPHTVLKIIAFAEVHRPEGQTVLLNLGKVQKLLLFSLNCHLNPSD